MEAREEPSMPYAMKISHQDFHVSGDPPLAGTHKMKNRLVQSSLGGLSGPWSVGGLGWEEKKNRLPLLRSGYLSLWLLFPAGECPAGC